MTLTVQTSTAGLDSIAASRIESADKTLNSFLTNPEVLSAFEQKSHPYVPILSGAVMAVLWGLMNTGDTSFLGKDGVQRAVYNEGGTTSEIDALWAQLSTDGNSIVSAGDFALNSYLKNAVEANMDAIIEDVEEARINNARAAAPTSILNFMMGGGDSVLSNFRPLDIFA